jgi:hypothetical protein
MRNSTQWKHVVLALATSAGLAAGCDSAADGDVPRSENKMPPGLAEYLRDNAETLRKNAITLHAGQPTLVEKDGGMTPIGGTVTGPAWTGYNLDVKTDACNQAGTDAKVYATLIHDNLNGTWTTQMFELDRPGINDFERGHLDQFSVRGINLGTVDYLYIEHDNGGGAGYAGWYLDYIDAFYFNGGAVAPDPQWKKNKCTFNRWLALDEGDGSLSAFTNCPPSS